MPEKPPSARETDSPPASIGPKCPGGGDRSCVGGAILAFLNATLDSGFIVDRDGVILAVNDLGARKMGGICAEEMAGRRMADFLAPDVFARRLEAIRTVWDSGKPLRFEDARDDNHFDNSLVPVLDSEGRVVNVVILARDVTARKIAEADLKRRAFRQGVLMELGLFALSCVDRDDLLDKTCRVLATLFNAEFTDILELSPDQDHLRMVAGYGWPAGLVGRIEFEMAGTQAGLAFVLGEPIVVEDLENDRRIQDKDNLLARNIKSGMSVVIHGKDTPYGVLGVHCLKAREYPPDEVLSLQNVANVLSEAIERFRAGQDIKDLNERNAAVLGSVAQGIYGVDAAGRITFANRSTEQLTGFSPLELIGANAHRLLHHTRPDGTGYPMDECPLTKTLVDGRHRQNSDEVYWRRDGSSFPAEYSCTPLVDRGRLEGAVVVFEDITERLKAKERLTRMALYDELTGLPNRGHFTLQLEKALEREKKPTRFAVLLLDLDDFKVINDGLGHTLGDRLINLAAQRIQDATGAGMLVARMGGDEFALLLTCPDADAMAATAARSIGEAFKEPVKLEQYDVVITASVGIVLDDGSYTQAMDVLRDADTAMFRAKSRGKGEWAVFDTAMHQEVRSRLILENDLRRALERNEFFLTYQPIVHLSTGRPAGFEALLRWRHPERGLVPPLDFIPTAESSGLILGIGNWVLAEACAQLAVWQRDIPGADDLTMSVNLSGRQFMQHDLPGTVAGIIAQAGVSPSMVKLEITETVVMEHAGSTVETLLQLRDTGVSLSIDDFGTGYSSLAYLRRFPVDTLKVDRTFVRWLDTDRDNLRIVRAVVEMARSMDMSLVAEGIETEGELSSLRGLGCALGQGYLFAKPLTVPEAGAYLTIALATGVD